MKISITADVQLHNHAAWSKILPNGRNSRLQLGVDCLYKSLTPLIKGDIMVVLGDVFHSRKSVEIDVLDAFCEWVDAVLDKGVLLILVAGNHDQFLNSGSIYSLRPWKNRDKIIVVESSYTFTYKNTILGFHAYSDDISVIRKFISAKFDFLFLHQSLVGADMGHGDLYQGDSLCLDDLNGVTTFLGHFHKPQQLGCAYYIGSPYQVDRGEAGQEKRFLLLDLDNGKIDSVKTGAPAFHTISFDEWSASHNQHDYYTVICDTEEQRLNRAPNTRFMLLPQLKAASDNANKTMVSTMEDAIKAWCSENGLESLTEQALARYRETEAYD